MADKNIYQAFVAVCAEMENVKRDTTGQVGQSKYKYAAIDAVLAVTQPLLAKNGLALVQYVEDDALKAVLIHESGVQMLLGSYPLGSLGKHQERGSAITYGRRYQLCSIFGIAQEDDDGAAASIEKKNNHPTNGDKTAQAEFGSATEFKKYYSETMGAIERLPNKEASSIINKRIERIEKVDEQSAMNLRDALDLQLDSLHMQDI